MSAQTISRMTDKIIPLVEEWQNCPLESSYPFVFMNAIHYKVKQNNHILSKAAYIVVGINTDGMKDVLGIWIGENETSKFWLKVLTDLKSVYQAPNEESGYPMLEEFEEKWSQRQKNWDQIINELSILHP